MACGAARGLCHFLYPSWAREIVGKGENNHIPHTIEPTNDSVAGGKLIAMIMAEKSKLQGMQADEVMRTYFNFAMKVPQFGNRKPTPARRRPSPIAVQSVGFLCVVGRESAA